MSISQHETMADYTFVSRYAKYLKDKKRRETYKEAVNRTRKMHLDFFKGKGVDDVINECFDHVEQKDILGSQRSLQFGGDAILRHNARGYNCSASYCDRLKFFQETMYLLLCGVGVGFSAQKHHIAKLPNLVESINDGESIYSIPDSIEGWSDAVGILLSSYMENPVFPEYHRKKVVFDYSRIRPKGSEFSHGIGTAPGPDGLRNTLEKIRELLNRCVENGLKKLHPIHAYDIVMHIADAVLSGGVRRSAVLCMFSLDDDEMMRAKTGNWFSVNPQRARSNNSVMLLRGSVTREQFEKFKEFTRQFGEPGFIWTSSYEIIFNPCVESGMVCYDEFGNSGWQMCVSGDTNLITKGGICKISDTVNQEIEIWNGNEWSKVKPFITGYNKKLFRVFLSDGSYLDCTDNHKWLIYDDQKNIKEVQTKDLTINSLIPRFNKISKENGIKEEYAYEYGFILGDGTVRLKSSPFAELFKLDKELPLRGIKGKVRRRTKYNVDSQNITFNDVNTELAFKIKHSYGLPNEIFNWDSESIANFFGGWIDADGSKANNGCRIYGPEDKIRDAQLLLTSIGVLSSVNLSVKAGQKNVIDGRTVIRKKDMWYLQIPDARKLKSYRIDLTNGKDQKQIKKNTFQKVVKIVELEGLHTTYCLTENKQNTCLFNNVVTKQCNLTTQNGSHIKTKEDFLKFSVLAAQIGTLQSAYTSFPYLGEVTERIVRKENIIGVSITGMMTNKDVLFNPEYQRLAAEAVVKANKELAQIIGVNQAARTTLLKPEGSTTTMLGLVAFAGCHPGKGKRVFRRIQANKTENPVKFYKNLNPKAVEHSVWSSNGTDDVITFCCESPEGAIQEKDLGAIEFLKLVLSSQKNWVNPGTNQDLCVQKGTSHNVSNTVRVLDSEWDEVWDFIYDNQNDFAGIAFISATGDKDYPQAPFCEIFTAEEIVREYGQCALFTSGLIEKSIEKFGDLWTASSTLLGYGEILDIKQLKQEIENNPTQWKTQKLTPRSSNYELAEWLDKNVNNLEAKRYWIERAKAFAHKYLDDDLKRLTYLLKDVYNWKLWLELTSTFEKPDFTKMIEEQNNTNVQEDIACAGGACLI